MYPAPIFTWFLNIFPFFKQEQTNKKRIFSPHPFFVFFPYQYIKTSTCHFSPSLAWNHWLLSPWCLNHLVLQQKIKLHIKTHGRNLGFLPLLAIVQMCKWGGLSAHLGTFKGAGTMQMERTSSIKPLTADKSFCSVQSLCCSGLISLSWTGVPETLQTYWNHLQ